MGRNKIDIKYITEPRKRQVTLNKRKGGLMKKAYELSVLCGCEISVLIKDQRGQSFVYSSVDPDEAFQTHLDADEPPTEKLDNRAMRHRFDSDASSDEDEEDDGKLQAARGRTPTAASRKRARPAPATTSKRPTGAAGKGKGKGKGVTAKTKAAVVAAAASRLPPIKTEKNPKVAPATPRAQRTGYKHKPIRPYDPDDYELDPPSRSNSGRRGVRRDADNCTTSGDVTRESGPAQLSELSNVSMKLQAITDADAATVPSGPQDEDVNMSDADPSETFESHFETDGADSNPDATPDMLKNFTPLEVGWRKKLSSLKVLMSAANNDGIVPTGIVRKPTFAVDVDAVGLIGSACGGLKGGTGKPNRRLSVPSDALTMLGSPSLSILGEVNTPTVANISTGFVDGGTSLWP